MANLHPEVHTLAQARQKIQRYCAYRERSHRETLDKLRSFKLREEWIQVLMAELVEQRFLNEERFARAYARGKHRNNGWGWLKIKQGLQYHQLSPYVLQRAQKEIPFSEYYNNLQNQAQNKWQQYRSLSFFARRGKTARYLIQRGFEPELVWDIIQDLKE